MLVLVINILKKILIEGALYHSRCVMKKNGTEVMEAELANRLLGDYLKELGIRASDHVFIRKVKQHIEIGRVSFNCLD